MLLPVPVLTHCSAVSGLPPDSTGASPEYAATVSPLSAGPSASGSGNQKGPVSRSSSVAGVGPPRAAATPRATVAKGAAWLPELASSPSTASA